MGDLYILNPLLLQHMVFTEEHFSNCLVLINDMISDMREEGLDLRLLSLLRMTLIEGKQHQKVRPGYCSVIVSTEKQR